MNKVMERAILARNKRHSYGYSASRDKYVIYAPINVGGHVVAILCGDVKDDATHLQADAMCKALDKVRA